MKKFILKFIAIFIPFMIAIGIEVLILPPDFFTFRVWEALRIKKFLSGKFYPNMVITKVEEGDLAAHTIFAYKRKVTWITDRYGYRKENTNRHKHEIVLIGDSNVAGCGLTQEDILSEVLEKRLMVSVYPLAPANVNTFFKDWRFKKYPPHVVIIASIERGICDLPRAKAFSKKTPTILERQLSELGGNMESQILDNRFIQFVGKSIDRMYKENMLYSLRARLRRIVSSQSYNINYQSISTKDGFVFFIQGSKANKDVSKDEFDRAVYVIKTYNEFLKGKGIRFIFLPIPNKENIYYKYLQTEKPIFLKQLISTLRNLGIETIDTQKAFDDAFQKGPALYQRDDTHWSAQGVKIAADLIEQTLKKDEWKEHHK